MEGWRQTKYSDSNGSMVTYSSATFLPTFKVSGDAAFSCETGGTEMVHGRGMWLTVVSKMRKPERYIKLYRLVDLDARIELVGIIHDNGIYSVKSGYKVAQEIEAEMVN